MATNPEITKVPCQAAMEGKWKKMIEHYKQHPPSFPITTFKDTPFHMAVYSKQAHPFKELFESIPEFSYEDSINLPDIESLNQGGLEFPSEPASTDDFRSLEFGFPNDASDLISRSNAFGNTVLHEAVMVGNVEVVELLAKKKVELLIRPNVYGETPLFWAAAYGQADIIQNLVNFNDVEVKKLIHNLIFESDGKKLLPIHRKKNDSKSILHIAIEGQHFETALLLMKLDETLAVMEDEKGMTPLHLLAKMPSAFASGFVGSPFEFFLYTCLPSEVNDDEDEAKTQSYKYSSRSFDLESGQKSEEKSPPYPTFNQFKELKLFGQYICKLFFTGSRKVERIIDEKKKHTYALKLLRLLIRYDLSWDQVVSVDGTSCVTIKSHKQVEEQKIEHNYDLKNNESSTNPFFMATSKAMRDIVDQILWQYHDALQNPSNTEQKHVKTEASSLATTTTTTTTNNGMKEIVNGIFKQYLEGIKKVKNKKERPPTPLFLATKNGIKEMFVEILKQYPQAVENLNDKGQNLLHVAVMHRQLDIFRLLKRKKIALMRMNWIIDNNGYTLLHQVGDNGHYARWKPIPAVLQLQEELKWFERVKKVVPNYYTMQDDNVHHMTPKELFEEKHQKQLMDARGWIKDTAQSCSAVSVLVATIVFAAAYTVPGGSDDRGLPVFLNSPYFWFFTFMDVISLASSLTSVVMFLSILTSAFEFEDFKKSLPQKLTFGFALLFMSLMTAMLAFGATILLIIHMERHWTTGLMSIAAFFPVSVFAFMHFRWYVAFKGNMVDVFKGFMKSVPCFYLPFMCTKWMCTKSRGRICGLQPGLSPFRVLGSSSSCFPNVDVEGLKQKLKEIEQNQKQLKEQLQMMQSSVPQHIPQVSPANSTYNQEEIQNNVGGNTSIPSSSH